MDKITELKARVEAKQKALEAQIAEARANAISKTNETIDHLEQRLAKLKTHLADGWDKVSDAVAGKLNEWLKD